MGLLFMFVAFIAFGLCLAEDETDRRCFWGGVWAMLYLPVEILLTLTKKKP